MVFWSVKVLDLRLKLWHFDILRGKKIIGRHWFKLRTPHGNLYKRFFVQYEKYILESSIGWSDN